MRKLLLTVLAICLMSFASVAGAQQQPNYNFVQVTDYGAQLFVEKMTACRTYQQLKQSGNLVAFVSPVRRQDLDDTQNFPGMSVYKSDFGIKGAPNSDGQIRFYVSPDGYVFIVQVINENANNPQVSQAVLLMTLETLGLSDPEGNTLLQTPTPVAETWCQSAGRKIIRVVTDQTGNNILFFGASN
ncbi:MAG: hypothetical protein IJ685_10815 [Selenomonadaceae bacterium]|nr:hypothetical protein [Selenomonadaceae bacterium]